MKEKTTVVKISVRNLVEFILRSGDLTSSGSGVRNTEAMLEGSRIHRKIQKSMGSGYESEVPLYTDISIHSDETDEDFTLMVEGRADGIFTDTASGKPLTIIDEIKGVYQDLSTLKEPVEVHLAQAKCYAYMVMKNEDLSDIGVQLTYCNMETEEIKRFKIIYTSDDIRDWFEDLVDKYRPWAVYEYDHAIKRNISIKNLSFPFEYRKDQDKLAAFTYDLIRKKGRLFIQAPTGVGKTITTIFPAVKAMGEDMVERIFYLTAKTITRTVAEDCFSLLADNGLYFKPITLTAKEKLCVRTSTEIDTSSSAASDKPPSSESAELSDISGTNKTINGNYGEIRRPDCDPDKCERAKGHLDRVNDALYDMLIHEEKLSRDIIIRYADKHTVCPFELSLDAALFADAVICDYNYVYDPNVYLKRFFGVKKSSDYVFLTDEAHNLVERGREMYSASIVKEDFLAISRICKSMLKKEHDGDRIYAINQLIKAVTSVNKQMLEWKRECDSILILESIGNLSFSLMRVVQCYEAMAAAVGTLPERETFLQFYFDVRNFLNIWETIDDHYIIYGDFDYGRSTVTGCRFRLTLKCMDPSNKLREVCDRARAGVFFSATLLPIRYYKEQLGGDADDPAVYARSSFDVENRRILIANDVTSLYKSRGPKMYQRIADYIERFISSKEGNYIVFFPSYKFMEDVRAYLSLPEDRTLMIQGSRMNEKEKEEFLQAFNGQNVIGMCVMGGIFSEGIDLTGDRLIGAAIVGTGLPMVCDERQMYKDYFDRVNRHGFDYAYLYPGLNKVFQAGGRVIRTPEDRGVILLLDDRFLRSEYTREFPREWRNAKSVTINSINDELRKFWD